MMTRRGLAYHSLLVPKGRPPIAVPRSIGGVDFIEYFPTEDDRRAAEEDEVRNKALDAAGTWSDADNVEAHAVHHPCHGNLARE